MEPKEDITSSSQQLTGMKPSDENKDQLTDVEPAQGYALISKADYIPSWNFFTTEVKTYLVMQLQVMETQR